MADRSAKFYDLLLLLFCRSSPYFPGKWRVLRAFASRAEATWKDPRVAVRRGCRYELDLRNFVQRNIYYLGYHETWETRFCEKAIKPGWVVADVGANIGYYTLIFSRLVEHGGRVYAFEPAEIAYATLLRNLALNDATRIKTHRVALADYQGSCSLTPAPGASLGLSRLTRKDEVGMESVPVTTLDAFIQEEGIDRLDLIKVDIEGAEKCFLTGAAQTLARLRPIVMIEVNPAALSQFGSTPDEVLRILKGHGYSLYRPTWTGLRPIRELAKEGQYVNVVSLPPRRAGACK
jgi:FkbM family methyltransferase